MWTDERYNQRKDKNMSHFICLVVVLPLSWSSSVHSVTTVTNVDQVQSRTRCQVWLCKMTVIVHCLLSQLNGVTLQLPLNTKCPTLVLPCQLSQLSENHEKLPFLNIFQNMKLLSTNLLNMKNCCCCQKYLELRT